MLLLSLAGTAWTSLCSKIIPQITLDISRLSSSVIIHFLCGDLPIFIFQSPFQLCTQWVRYHLVVIRVPVLEFLLVEAPQPDRKEQEALQRDDHDQYGRVVVRAH